MKLDSSLTSLKTGCVVAQRLRSARAAAACWNGGVSGATGVQVALRARQEGHVGQILVRVLGVQRHGAQGRRQVSESQRHTGGAAIHHARIHEGADGVELLSVAPRQASSNAAGRRAEERHAALGAIARIRQRNLKAKRMNSFPELRVIQLTAAGSVEHLYGKAGRLLAAGVRAVSS